MTEKEQQIKAGQDAKLLLENPQMVAAFNSVLNNGYQQWISTEIKDTEGREALYHKQRVITYHKKKANIKGFL